MAKSTSNLVFSMEADEACAWLAVTDNQASLTLSGMYDLQADSYDKLTLWDAFARLGPGDVWEAKGEDIRLEVTVFHGDFQVVLRGGTTPVKMVVPLDYVLGRLA